LKERQSEFPKYHQDNHKINQSLNRNRFIHKIWRKEFKNSSTKTIMSLLKQTVSSLLIIITPWISLKWVNKIKKIWKNHSYFQTPTVRFTIILQALLPANAIQLHIMPLNKVYLSQWNNRNSWNTKNNMETRIK